VKEMYFNNKQNFNILILKPSTVQSSLFQNGALMEFDSYGKWVGGCGKYFMFSQDKVEIIKEISSWS
jgi:hypothetical protein